ncbi:MAG: hypothetical protein HY514_04340 [Candidatus Aenigmarchaeota archaeon]|nr:hypothetical protein [Candidatus Aenigmarchaeota archaeon]
MNYDRASLRERGLGIVSRHAGSLAHVVSEGCYSEIFTALRAYPIDEQRQLLEKFYKDFPNGDRVAAWMLRVNNVPWLSAKHANSDLVRAYFTEHLDRLKPFYTGEPADNYDAARGAAVDAVRDATLDAAVVAAWGATLDAAWGATVGATLDVAMRAAVDATEDAGRGAGYEIVIDLLKEPNPWGPLLEINESGVLVREYRNRELSVYSRSGMETMSV